MRLQQVVVYANMYAYQHYNRLVLMCQFSVNWNTLLRVHVIVFHLQIIDFLPFLYGTPLQLSCSKPGSLKTFIVKHGFHIDTMSCWNRKYMSPYMKSFCLSILNGCIFNFISTGVAEIIHPLIKRGCPSTCSIYKKEQTTRDTKKASEICIHYTASLKNKRIYQALLMT